MMCNDCKEREVIAKGLCKRCYTKIQRREAYKKNPEVFRERQKRWYKNNKHIYDEYRKKNYQKILIYRRKYENKYRQDILDLLGRECIKCGFNNWMGLQLDHINGGGTKEMKMFLRPKAMYQFYLKNPEKAKKVLQILCANCNQIKRYENNENRKL